MTTVTMMMMVIMAITSKEASRPIVAPEIVITTIGDGAVCVCVCV